MAVLAAGLGLAPALALSARQAAAPSVLPPERQAAPPAVFRPEPLREQAEEIASYDISVTLDPAAKQLKGKQRLTWRNPSTDTVGDLWFHLYLNAFRNSKSTFFRESGGHLRDDQMPEDGWGWIDVTSMRLADGSDLKPSLQFEAPDDGNKDDRTVAKIVLPRPVGPGETIAVDVEFTAQLPRVFARTGYVREYFLVGQWFPKLAVYEPAGMRGRTAGGWNCHQFHGHSEFYANFGRYRVDITLPSNFVVGATGVRAERRDNGNGTATYVYEQANVHDFAWTASPHFVELRRKFVASAEVAEGEYESWGRMLDRSVEQMRLHDVDITLLMQPEHMPQAERHFRSAMLAIKWFGLWYGRYPHRTLTIVDPASGASGSGGMEYPTFITAGTTVWFNRWPFDGVRAPEEVTIHEYGHQYFQGMIANNEFEEAWLDEGINSYSSSRAMERGYGHEGSLVSLFGWRIGERDYLRQAHPPDVKFTAINRPAWSYPDDWSYGVNSYIRPALLLRTIENHVGEETMARIMRTYAERWRFRHPTTQDFYAVANEVSGRDLQALMSQVVDRGDIVDYEVDEVTSEVAVPAAGYVDGPKGRTFVRQEDAARQAEERAADSVESTGGELYDTRVVVRRRGEAILPIDIAFKFEGKAVEREKWDGQARLRVFTFQRPERLEWVDIDPDRKYEMDVDWMNNAMRVDPDRRAAVRLTSRWTFLTQQMLALLGM